MTPATALTLLLSLPAGLALGQAPPAPERPGPRPERPGPPPRRFEGRNPDEMRKSLSLFFIHRARVELGLSDEQALKLLPMVEKIEQERQESGRRRGDIARQLETLATEPAVKDEEVQPLVRALDKEEERMRVEQSRARDEMMALLTPQQKARFVLFAHRFRGALEDKVRERRGERMNDPGGRPGDEPDDLGGPPPLGP